ncbi:DUF4331 domain-containing protein [Streptomyces sp. NBC_01795]|uniref:DUF4331 domain-containing protein n=1 Tax=unclassified Streptomyces TaxID=2593676 RepID=UPI002DD83B5E|nr:MULTISPECIES: DUF4331 domain-containing protein [unclassified Streptomyces]WSA91784.1 DUF4331 domain-containing protein [Streptomyces sp. NBC_01795]WSB76154.1 DUF4331 domain-containing protein [Streptomyces sp. NBC_01775]
MFRTGRASRRRFAVVGAATAVAGAALAGPLIPSSRAGGHVDAPSSVADTAADITDVYAFTSPDAQDAVTLIANVRPFQLPGNATNSVADYPFANGARYEINTDADGDGKPDTAYRWTFKEDDRRRFPGQPKVGPMPVRSLEDRSLGVRQTYVLERIRGNKEPETLVRDGIAAPTHAGNVLMPNYAKLRREATRDLPGGGRTLAGQSAEAFKADSETFGLYTAGSAGPVRGWLPDAQPLSVLNVNSLVLQVPKEDIALSEDPRRNPVVGVWASVSRPGANLDKSLSRQNAPFHQVSRQGHPHVAFGVFGSTIGLAKPGGPEDRFQQREPKDDHLEQDFLDAVNDPVPPHRIERAEGFKAPVAPRKDIEALFLRGIGKDNGATFGYDLNTHTMNADADSSKIVPAEELRLNLTTPVSRNPKPDGVLDGDRQGFPNGRRLNDTIDGPLIRLLEGEPAGPSAKHLLPTPSLKLQPADAKDTFPYLNSPHAAL